MIENFGKSIQSMEKMGELESSNADLPTAYLYRGLVSGDSGNIDSATADLKKALD